MSAPLVAPSRPLVTLRVHPAGGGWSPEHAGAVPLARDEVHVWCVALTASPRELEGYRRLLDSEERERLARLRFAVHRRRWTVSRARWRQLLAGYLGCASEEVALRRGPRGRPHLVPASAVEEGGLDTNLSHSGDWALCAFSRGRRVGVDVEVMRPRLAVARTARRVLTAAERELLSDLRGESLRRAFLSAWTRKEAWLKAIGEGLRTNLRSFQVLPAAAFGETARAEPGWWLLDLSPAEGTVGCLAAAGEREPCVRLLRLRTEAGGEATDRPLVSDTGAP